MNRPRTGTQPHDPTIVLQDFATLLYETMAALDDVSDAEQTLVGIGVRADGSGDPTPWEDLEKMLVDVEAAGLSPSIWYSHAVVELYPKELSQLLNGNGDDSAGTDDADDADDADDGTGDCNADCYNCVLYGGGVACGGKCSSCSDECYNCVVGGGGTGCATKCT